MRSAGFLYFKRTRVSRFICMLLLATLGATMHMTSIHAQSPASAVSKDESARPLEPADASASSEAAHDKQPQIGAQSETLVQMALDLQKEVNRTSDKTISAAALRKADEIEKLVKELAAIGHNRAAR